VEREAELDALCHPLARETVARLGIRLCTYAEVRRRLPPGPSPDDGRRSS